MSRWLLSGLGLAIIALLLRFGAGAEYAFATVPTPSGLNAATVYSVTNPGVTPLLVQHTHTETNSGIVVLTFSHAVPAGATVQYRVLEMPQIPSPYVGSLLLEADQPFTAEVTGYDYSPTATMTVTMSPTGTVTLTTVVTPSSTSTPSPILTPAATPTPYRVWLPIIKEW